MTNEPDPHRPHDPRPALIEAAGKATPGPWRLYWRGGDQVIESESSLVLCDDPESSNMEYAELDMPFIVAARNATASISQLLSEHDALIEEIRLTSELADSMNADCGKLAREHVRQIAKRLQSIVEGK